MQKCILRRKSPAEYIFLRTKVSIAPKSSKMASQKCISFKKTVQKYIFASSGDNELHMSEQQSEK